jgi:hypothetical protein
MSLWRNPQVLRTPGREATTFTPWSSHIGPSLLLRPLLPERPRPTPRNEVHHETVTPQPHNGTMPVRLECALCGVEFFVAPHQLRKKHPRRFCSNECYWKSGTPKRRQRAGATRPCEICGKDFYAKPSRSDQRRCSRACGSVRGPLLTCKVCGTQYRRGPWHVEHMGSSTCSVKCRDIGRRGYVPSEETRRKIGAAHKGLHAGKANPRYGQSPPHLGRGKWTYYKGTHFRSSYEVRFATALDALGVKWLYEPERLVWQRADGTPRTTLIDFFLPEDALYVEVKGWVQPVHQEMVESLRSQGLSVLLATLDIIKAYESLGRQLNGSRNAGTRQRP